MRITSPDNPVVRRLRRLAGSARACREAGRTLAEGLHVIEAALAAQVAIVTIATRGSSSPAVAALVERVQASSTTVKLVELGAALYDAISPVEHGVGVLAEIMVPSREASPLSNEDAVFLDAVQDPGNVGTLLRTAAAAGVWRIFTGPGSAYVWAPKVMRAAMGAHFALNIEENTEVEAMGKNFRGTVIADYVEGDDLYAAEWGRGATLWLFGSEGQGLSREVRAAARLRLRIPLAGQVESLNVAAAAAVCLFEQARRRRRYR
ncbi:MAG: TrmH family RNA methyltransferase [Burkholderiaceae bacterium]